MSGVKNNVNGGIGFQGKDLDDGAFSGATAIWNASSADAVFYIAKRRMIVSAITARIEVAGTDAGAVTAVVKKASSGTALGSGTALHSGTINLKGTAATNQALTLAAADTLVLAAGDCLAIDYTGILTAAVGAVTVALLAA